MHSLPIVNVQNEDYSSVQSKISVRELMHLRGKNEEKDNKNNEKKNKQKRDYSRTAYTLGTNAMNKIFNSSCAVIGVGELGSVGFEICKNILLTGIKEVHIFCNTMCNEKTKTFIKEINPFSNVIYYDNINDMLEILASQFNGNKLTVVSADSVIYSVAELSSFCECLKFNFIVADTVGPFGCIFCDFGNKFIVTDDNGISPNYITVSHVYIDNGRLFLMLKETHNLETGDCVLLYDVKTNNEEYNKLLNNCLYKVAVTSTTDLELIPYTKEDLESEEMKILLENNLSEHPKWITQDSEIRILKNIDQINSGKKEFTYKSGGYILNIKIPKVYNFKRLTDFTSIANDINENNVTNIDYAIPEFLKKEQMLFQLFAERRFKLDKKLAEQNKKIEDRIENIETMNDSVKAINTIFTWIEDNKNKFDLPPLYSIIGGWAAQEVINSVTGTYIPIKQFLFEDFSEIITKFNISTNEQIKDIVKKANVFVVGAGALGCEILKNLALLNVENVDVTDPDTIENSNLTRQFLFSEKDVQKNKAKTAIENALKLPIQNSYINTENKNRVNWYYHEDLISPSKEYYAKFNKKFWFKKNCVINALDNIAARRFMDNVCSFYNIPLLESGTQGSMANTQTIIPHVTASYSESNDNEETGTLLCTIHNFPSTIQHCITYIMNFYKEIFANDCVQKAESHDFQTKIVDLAKNFRLMFISKEDKLKEVTDITFIDCITCAIDLFENNFDNKIEEILRKFPPDAMNSDQSGPFWSNEKRCPHAIAFDRENKIHLLFAFAGGILLANLFSIEIDENVKKFINTYEKWEDIFEKQKVIQEQELQSLIMYSENISNKDEYESKKEGNIESTKIGIVESGTKDIDELSTVERYVTEGLVNYKICNKDDNIKIYTSNKYDDKLGTILKTHYRPILFDKDNIVHSILVTTASNIRATNYQIEMTSLNEVRRIAGSIIPAMVTTTSIIVGYVMMEFLKIMKETDSSQQIDNGMMLGKSFNSEMLPFYRNTYINLAGPIRQYSEPEEVKIYDYLIPASGEFDEMKGQYTIYDYLTIEGDREKMTFRNLIEEIEDIFGPVDVIVIDKFMYSLNPPLNENSDVLLSKVYPDKNIPIIIGSITLKCDENCSINLPPILLNDMN